MTLGSEFSSNFFCPGVKEGMGLVNWEDSAEESLSELISYKLPASKSGAIVSRRFA